MKKFFLNIDLSSLFYPSKSALIIIIFGFFYAAFPSMVRGQTLYRVNAGGPQVTTGGNTWLADQPYNGVWGWVGNDYNTASVGSAIAGTTDPSLYQTNAYGYLSYIFPATCGDVYSVTLKFAETYWGSGNGTTGPGSRIFDVVINNNVVLTNFDIYSDTTGQATFDTSAKTTAGANIADDHVFTGITANAQGQIYIQLGPDTSDVAEVQAIQIDQTGTTPCLSTATNTPVATPTACSGGYIQQTEIPLTSDSVTYIALQSTADPAGWQAQGYSAAGWAHPFVWTASGYAPISAGVPWMSWQNSTTNGTTQWARQLVIHPFSLPANATNISASYTYASDDNMTTEINGVSVESENDTLMSYDTINTITVPVGVIQPGPAINVLTLDNENPQIVIMGYTFRLTINYEIPCPTLTNTPTNTSTSTPTNTLTNTVTNTDTNTATNTSTSTATNTVTNTMTSTTVFTATNTPTNTATNTVTNTATITVSNTVTNTSTLTATNTVTSTPTSTPTITNTPPPSATPTNTNTPGPTLTIQKKASESTAQAGDTITYDVLLSVSGSAASGILVQDTLPANVTFKGFENPTPGVTVTTSQNGGNLSWSFASLPVGTYDLPYQVTVNSFVSGNTPLFNQAWVTFGGGGPVTASCQVAITGQYTVKINIYNSSGEVVKTIPAQQYSQAINSIALQPGNVITTLQGPGSTLQIYFEGNLIATWDGTNNSQNPVMNGNYKIQVDNVSSTGEVTSVSQPAVVNRKLSNVTATIYNSAGEAVRTLFDVVGEANTLQMTNVDLSANVIDLGAVNGSATSLNIFVLTTGNAVTLTWDGSNNNETNVMPGTYEIELHWDNGQGQTMDISRSIIVTATGGVSGVVIARPNVLSSKDTMTTTFDGTSIANATTLNVRIYTVAGELVASPPASGAATATWNASGVASGIYIAVVKVEDANGGVVKQQSLKVLVLH